MADFLVRGRRRRCHIVPVDRTPAALIAESVTRATRSRFSRPAQNRESARLGTNCPFTDTCANRPLNGAFRSDCKGFCIYLM